MTDYTVFFTKKVWIKSCDIVLKKHATRRVVWVNIALKTVAVNVVTAGKGGKLIPIYTKDLYSGVFVVVFKPL